MATVTGYTAARMQEIEDSAIIGGVIVGDDLILTRYDEGEINAGNVRGPTGSPGVTEGELDDFILNTSPVGSITDYIGAAAPPKWALLQGQILVNAVATHPDLWAIVPASMKSGNDIILPDARGRMTVGLNAADAIMDAMGETGGSKNAIVVSHVHTGPSHTHTGPSHTHTGPSHTHSIDHNHASFNTSSSGAHTHVSDVSGSSRYMYDAGVAGIYTSPAPGTTFRSEFMTNGGTHAHAIDVPSFSGTSGSGGTGNTGASGTANTGASGTGNTGSTGSSGTNANMPPFIAFNKIIKVE